jgi:ABC-type siderophore export system fused ATPase/permease subunit
MAAFVLSLLCSVLSTLLLVVFYLFPLPDRHAHMALVSVTMVLLVVCMWAAVVAAADLSHEMQRLRDIETSLRWGRNHRDRRNG